MSDDIEEVKDKLRAKKSISKINWKKGLSSGSTLFNLASTNLPSVCFMPGKYYWLIGDSQTGKTALSLSCLAEASINPHYDDYRFIYDNTEDGVLMDIEKLFGRSVAERIEPPSCDDKRNPIYSTTIQEFYYHLDDAVDQETPFIYVLDSMDGIDSQEEQKTFEDNKQAFLKGKESKGTYGTSKAKANSSGMRRARNGLQSTDSILIIVSQTRDNIGFGFNPQTVGGGKALRFYATMEIWTSPKGKINKTVKGKQRQIGVTSQIHIKKNRHTGQESKVDLNIYYSHGIDDIGNMINFLIEEGHWQKTKSAKKMEFPEFDFSGTEDKFIEMLEETRQEDKLKELTAKVWNEIVEGCQLKRKKRYE